ncbi:hypothetical protein [Microbacterium sp. T32]|uniref:hypothetical protein n=1 Tax=Microbacterium sp. T32 TaxID=1776083 RepID=UPI0007AB6714|nr:hypothetical protein [Microbacterium sp. T32]KZE33983.1 hypothetical protein AVW09_05880 [Microbacterium sp. T32]
MRRVFFVLPLVAVCALAGCSQVAAIAPVGGNHLTEVRFATIDVLQQQGVALEEVPTCTRASDGAISCAGTTADGAAVTAASPADDPDSFTVTVGSDTVFTGSVSAVIDQAAGVNP